MKAKFVNNFANENIEKAKKLIDEWFNAEYPELALKASSKKFLEIMLLSDDPYFKNIVKASRDSYKNKPLFRGLILSKNIKVNDNIKTSGLSSWTTDIEVAFEYAVGTGSNACLFIIKKGLPKNKIVLSDIFKKHRYMLDEEEFVIISSEFNVDKIEFEEKWGTQVKKIYLSLIK